MVQFLLGHPVLHTFVTTWKPSLLGVFDELQRGKVALVVILMVRIYATHVAVKSLSAYCRLQAPLNVMLDV